MESVREHNKQMITTAYLSTDTVISRAGDALAALGADVSRQAPPARHTVTEGVRSLVEVLARLIPGKSKAVKREKALATCSSLVNALVLERAVDDPALSAGCIGINIETGHIDPVNQHIALKVITFSCWNRTLIASFQFVEQRASSGSFGNQLRRIARL